MDELWTVEQLRQLIAMAEAQGFADDYKYFTQLLKEQKKKEAAHGRR